MAAVGTKRTQKEEETPRRSPFISMFEAFRDELDEHHDRRERLIKASRDITALSKKIIFSLQRVRILGSDIPASISKENSERKELINKLFLAQVADLKGPHAWRYQRQTSGGIQEFIEAVSFEYYIKTQSLVKHEAAASLLPPGLLLTDEDYVLGISDLVGEMMRFAITNVATLTTIVPGTSLSAREDANTAVSSQKGQRNILVDLRSIRAGFESLDASAMGSSGLNRDLEKKMEVLRQSVEKVEKAAYGMTIRGGERPKGWRPDLMDTAIEPIESSR